MPDLWFYVDDSGTRHLDRPSTPASTISDWFALGGVLFDACDKEAIEKSHARFMERWPMIQGPLHSNEIRQKTGPFLFLRDFSAKRVDEFHADLSEFLLELPVLALACVIDRPGYVSRFAPVHGQSRLWKLCKSAFSIVTERAAKHAERHQAKLRIAVERTTKADDLRVEQYFQELLVAGAPFGAANSAQYAPMTGQRLQSAVHDTLSFKTKRSACMQVADLYLYPISQGRYRPNYGPLIACQKAGKLLDCHLSSHEVGSCGIKYYCFPEKTKAPESEPLAA